MNTEIDRIKVFLKQGYDLYIYGTGLWGRNVYHELRKQQIPIKGFVVTKKENMEKLFELTIFEYFELEHKKVLLVLGLNKHNTKEVVDYLKMNHFDNERIFYSDTILGISDVRCGYDEVPCLDITTKIGCNVNCKYCPQAVLVNAYFEENKGRERYLSVDTLEKCMDHMPENVNYQFGGMAEAFLNPDCLELIRTVCKTKHTVNLYTTLVGVTEDMLYEIIDLPIDYVTLHVADIKGYAKIPATDEYYRLLEIAVNAKKKNGNRFIDMCNSQAEPDPYVSDICEGKYIITSTLLDRAGNLQGDRLVSKCIKTGRISCGICGKALNKNELMPDGTLLLCCMDYGMKHVLGNLKEQSYSEIMKGTEMKRVKEGMEINFEDDILCRSCSSANLIDWCKE